MDLQAILARIEERLKALGLSPDKASTTAGVPDAIRNMRRAVKAGRRGVSTKTLEALAPVLEVSSAWLLGSGANTDVDLAWLKTERDRLRAEADAIDVTISIFERRQAS